MKYNQSKSIRDPLIGCELENRKLQGLIAMQSRLYAERNIDRLLPLVIRELSSYCEADRGTLFLMDWERMELRTRFAEGVDEGSVIRVPLRPGLVGLSLLQKTQLNIADAYHHPFFLSEIDQVSGYRTETILVHPVLDDNHHPLGAVQFLNSHGGHFRVENEIALEKEVGEGDVARILMQQDRQGAQAFIDAMVERLNCERGSMFRLDPDHLTLEPFYCQGMEQTTFSVGLNLGIAGYAAVTGEVLNIRDAYADPRFNSRFDRETGYRTRSILCLPFHGQDGEILGVIQLINKREDSGGVFTDQDEEGMRHLTALVAVALENALLHTESEKQFQSILEVMAASIDAKDPLTAGHSMRVSHYAREIGRELGLSEKELDVIRVAALLHDYGKLGVEDVVLKKPGKLTPEEYSHIKTHVTITRTILEKMRFSRKYRHVPTIASAHHEFLDGTGYDTGLRHREIPFFARIVTVADVFEALTADRHYRKGMTPEMAFSILDKDIGSKFDERAVMALHRYVERMGKDAVTP